ncbi:MAG: glycosyltransferase [Acetatifactor sp.]|nr:glycosyltransferase [Acetatifactor sp.]
MKSNIQFSIIVVCLNPGEKLKETLESILSQTYTDFEVIIKDGGSKDGSLEQLPKDERIRLYCEPDKSIYEAMNQAVQHANADYVLFMNCGDLFHHDTVLSEAAVHMQKTADKLHVFYGDTYSTKNDTLIASPREIDGFTCYRNIPCHQSCFYALELCKNKPYETSLRIRADYDHFLWCYYVAKASMNYLGITVSSYEGGGYSESKENQKRDKEEHRQIVETYMSKSELFRYRAIMALTLAPLRSAMAESPVFSKLYHGVKQLIYRG